MGTIFRFRGVPALLASALLASAAFFAIAGWPAPSALAGTAGGPNLVKGSAYLVAPANLIGGHYYSAFGRNADFGLTIDGALALAATGDQDQALSSIVSFLATGGKDAAGKTVNSWTGIGTRYANGGAIGKEALLAEVVGANPRDFGGKDLIAALAASICPRARAGGQARCPAAGSYSYATSVFDQALGVIAQLRAGQRREAAKPVRYLASLQHKDGSFPSLIPASGGDVGSGDVAGGDVDSTAMAVMALALVPGRAAAAEVSAGVGWIAGQQKPDGGFPGAGGTSVNTAGLAVQALALRKTADRARLDAAEGFLASEQNADGGFKLGAGNLPGSNLRASAQAVGGAAGIPFGSLSRPLNRPAASRRSGGSGRGWVAYLVGIVLALAIAAVAVALWLRRPRRGRVAVLATTVQATTGQATTEQAEASPANPVGRLRP